MAVALMEHLADAGHRPGSFYRRGGGIPLRVSALFGHRDCAFTVPRKLILGWPVWPVFPASFKAGRGVPTVG